MLVSQVHLKCQAFSRKLKIMNCFDCVKLETTFLNSSCTRLNVLNKFVVRN